MTNQFVYQPLSLCRTANTFGVFKSGFSVFRAPKNYFRALKVFEKALNFVLTNVYESCTVQRGDPVDISGRCFQ